MHPLGVARIEGGHDGPQVQEGVQLAHHLPHHVVLCLRPSEQSLLEVDLVCLHLRILELLGKVVCLLRELVPRVRVALLLLLEVLLADALELADGLLVQLELVAELRAPLLQRILELAVLRVGLVRRILQQHHHPLRPLVRVIRQPAIVLWHVRRVGVQKLLALLVEGDLLHELLVVEAAVGDVLLQQEHLLADGWHAHHLTGHGSVLLADLLVRRLRLLPNLIDEPRHDLRRVVHKNLLEVAHQQQVEPRAYRIQGGVLHLVDLVLELVDLGGVLLQRMFLRLEFGEVGLLVHGEQEQVAIVQCGQFAWGGGVHLQNAAHVIAHRNHAILLQAHRGDVHAATRGGRRRRPHPWDASHGGNKRLQESDAHLLHLAEGGHEAVLGAIHHLHLHVEGGLAAPHQPLRQGVGRHSVRAQLVQREEPLVVVHRVLHEVAQLVGLQDGDAHVVSLRVAVDVQGGGPPEHLRALRDPHGPQRRLRLLAHLRLEGLEGLHVHRVLRRELPAGHVDQKLVLEILPQRAELEGIGGERLQRPGDVLSRLVHGDAPLLRDGAAGEGARARGLDQGLQRLEAEALALERVLQRVIHNRFLHAEEVIILHLSTRFAQQVVVVLLRDVARRLRGDQLHDVDGPVRFQRSDGVVSDAHFDVIIVAHNRVGHRRPLLVC
mmetsp:Transcript_38454/g.64637  ORF Transcript_38454/g.64637 Transcript_38454/m.64637 type:complete len:664 (+) Transcript_38454:1822-3813(+)